MILVVVVAMVPPTISGMICLILHRSMFWEVGSMATICTFLMYLMKYLTLVR
jgi:hypothetical protein